MRGRILYGTKKFREDAISFLFLVGGEGEKFYTVLKSFGIGGYFDILVAAESCDALQRCSKLTLITHCSETWSSNSNQDLETTRCHQRTYTAGGLLVFWTMEQAMSAA